MAKAVNTNRIHCLRQIHAAKKSQKVLDTLSAQKLPPEVVLEIMKRLALKQCRTIELQKTDILTALRESAMGDSKAAREMHEVFSEAVMKTSRIIVYLSELTVSDAEPLPHIATSLPYGIRHLEIPITPRVSREDVMHPLQLFLATRAIAVLPTQWPNLKSVTLDFYIRDSGNYKHFDLSKWDSIVCLSESGHRISFRKAMEDLITKFRGLPTSATKVLKGGCQRFDHGTAGRLQQCRKGEAIVRADMTVEEILMAGFSCQAY